jgi:archaellum biogenesis protein FlaJ (TadC family)
MILLLLLFVYYLGAVGTLLLICKNVPLERFVEKGGDESLYKIGCVGAVLIWPITIIIGLITLIFRKNEDIT